MKPTLKVGFDMVFLVFPGIDSLSSRQAQLSELMKRSGILRSGEE
jgi:hypothetical protein